MQSLVQIENLDFAYRDQLVLKHINLPIDAGSTLGLIGPNGGGKTTLVKLLLGLLQPTRGAIRIAGLSPKDAVARGDLVGYLAQNPAVTPNFPISVHQAVTLGLAGKTGMLKPYARPDLAFVDQLLERVGLFDLRDQAVSQISGGQLQRVLIARALASRPKLLLLDEPTTGIDRSGQQRFIDLISQLRRELDLTIVFVSHDLRTVSAVCDRIACLNLTLHYHDVPHNLPEDLAHQLFACDLEAMGIHRAAGSHECPDCATESPEIEIPDSHK